MTNRTEIDRSEPFVANDGGRWFVMQNVDYETDDGFPSASTDTLGNQWGYDTKELAEAALRKIELENDPDYLLAEGERAAADYAS